MKQTVRTLMSSLIDYAGLFPPAKLDMAETIEQFARASRSEEAWMLGRIIIPASRIGEFEELAPSAMPGTHAYSGYQEHADLPAWLISVVNDGELDATIERASTFNERHMDPDNGLCAIDAIELKARSTEHIEEVIDVTPHDFRLFIEIPWQEEMRGMMTALAGTEACAKLRTGGVTEDAFPPAERVAQFLALCHAAHVPFKATAGLHHPIRAPYRLTYEPASPTGMMHGFLNVFLAAAFVRTNAMDEREATRVLEETSIENFTFEDNAVWWHESRIEAADLAKVRETFALSYGSCSFAEPVEDLRKVGLL
jgi:hypothetical protein